MQGPLLEVLFLYLRLNKSEGFQIQRKSQVKFEGALSTIDKCLLRGRCLILGWHSQAPLARVDVADF